MKCELCNSPNIFKNKILNSNICGYCFFNFQNGTTYNQILDQKIFNFFIKALPDIEKYKNSVLISKNELIKNHYNIQSCDYNVADELEKKQLSKFLYRGKIDCILIPDSSFISLKSLIDNKDFYSDNIDIYFGIFTPNFILNNIEAAVMAKYVYSLFSISKFISLNNLDIYDIYEDIDYMLLKIKFGECKDNNFINKLQDIWANQELSAVFNSYDFS